MVADSGDGLLPACAHAGDDVVCVFDRGASRRRRGLRELVSDPFAFGADRLDGFGAARGRAADDLV